MTDPNRIVVVLDYASAKDALALAARLNPAQCRVKVGKELFTAAGPAVVEALQQNGFEVFLDLKYHDIPNTVAGACRAAAALGVWMVNVHASGGRAMMGAAREAIDRAQGKKPLLIGVTVLTSLDDSAIEEIGITDGAAAQVKRLTMLAIDCGLDGVVCSAEEASLVKTDTRADFLTVTPGIRLAGDAKGDQRRVVTPADAIRMGADYLVIGRSITHAADPVATLERIQQDIANAHMERAA
jgi:orotidine-5'-phosphate decarboxylase